MFVRFLLVVATANVVHSAPAFPSSPAGVWKWVEMEGSTCMDGKSTGVWYRHGSENDGLVVFMDGGGACFNLETCDTAAHDSHPGNPGSHGQILCLKCIK